MAAVEPLESRMLLSSGTPPQLLTHFAGIDFDQNATNAGSATVPADPMAAASADYVVTVVNTSIEVLDKSGTVQLSQSLPDFFFDLTPSANVTNPRVIYDRAEDRFIVMALDQTTTPQQTSRILLAVSASADPNGSWYTGAIDAKTNVNGVDCSVGNPAIATDGQAIYITGNLFSFADKSSQGSRLWIVNKLPIYNGGTIGFAAYDAAAAAGVPTATSLAPAQIFGSPGGLIGTYLLSSGSDGAGGDDFLGVITVQSPLSSPTFTNAFVDLGDIDSDTPFPNAPQLGGADLIGTGGGAVTSAVWRGGNLYAANTINPVSGPDAGQATAHWYRIDTTAMSLADQGDVGGEDIAPQTATFDPSIAVDTFGDMAIGFSASGPSIHPGAYFTGRLATDPAGQVWPAGTLNAGQDYYLRTLGGGSNRWGDYSSVAIDPADGLTFWAYNQYAMTRGSAANSEDGRWATAVGSFQLAPPPAVGSIEGSVYYDLNKDGQRGQGELGLANRNVYLDLDKNGKLDTRTSAANSSDVPHAIDDFMTVKSIVTVSGMNYAVSHVKLKLNIAHSSDGAVQAYLLSPSGKRVLLFDQVGGTGQNFTDTVLDDNATTSIDSGTAPFTGTFSPTGSLADFNGENPDGAWVLEVSDLASPDTGTLNSWTLTLTTSEPTAATDSRGVYEFSALAPGTYNVHQGSLPPGWTRTAPSNGLRVATVTAYNVGFGNDFGNYQAPGTLHGRVYNDSDANGALEAGEVGLSGWRVYLDSNGNGQFDQSSQNFAAPGMPLAIADNSTTSSSLSVAGTPGTIQSLTVTLNINHPNDSDLSAYLISPAGTRVALFNAVGDSGQNFSATVLDDSASSSISSGAAPFTGSFRPAQPLSILQGQVADGAWTLELDDAAAPNQGTLLSWSLQITSAEPGTLSDASGNYTFTELPAGVYRVHAVVQDGWTQTDPAGQYYSASLSSGATLTGLNFGDYQKGEIRGTVWNDADGDGVRDPGENGLAGRTVYLDVNNNGALDVSTPQTQSSGSLNWPIPDGDINGIDSHLTFSGLQGLVKTITVTVNIVHAYDSDLEAYLTSPKGTTIALFLDVGADGQSFTGTIFDDSAGISINSGIAPFHGRFRPQDPLSTFAGEDPNGDWTLNVADTVTGDTGSLTNWSMTIDAPYSEPTATTDASGNYAFTALNPGSYVVRQVVPSGWVATAPASGSCIVALLGGQVSTGNDLGERAPLGEIHGTVFNDLNGNGTRDPGEGVLDNWRVYIDANGNGQFDPGEVSAISDANGNYVLPNLMAGTYMVSEEPQDGWVQTYPTAAGTSVSASPAPAPAPAVSKMPFGASASDTAEFMIGDVYVNVVLMESDGSIDPNTEDWSAQQIANVKTGVQNGLNWWQQMYQRQTPAPTSHLTFIPDFTYADNPVPTGYEPITHSGTDDNLWIEDFLTKVGYNSHSGDYFGDLTKWNNAQRIAHNTNWAYTIFVANSKNTTTGEFTDGQFAYAYFGGPMVVMTYDNDGWGISRMGQVLAHETGHIFYAMDEYAGEGNYTDHSGYYDTQNLNAADGNPDPSSRVASIMAESALQDPAYANYTSSPTSLQMVGWRDTNQNGIPDVLDVPMTLTGSGHYDPATGNYVFTGTSAVATLPNQNPQSANAHDITLNTVDHLQYRLDGGPWTELADYGGYAADVSATVPVANGRHHIDFRTVSDDTKVTSTLWSADFGAVPGAQLVTLGAGQVQTGVDFGDHQTLVSTIEGTGGDDAYYVTLNNTASALLVYPDATGFGLPVDSIPVTLFPSLTFDLQDGNDSITLANGTGALGLLRINAGAGRKTLIVNGGTSSIDAGSAPGLAVVLNNAAVVNFPGSQTLASLALNGSSRVNLLADGSRFLRTGGLSIAGSAVLDLMDNDLIVQATPDTRDAVLTAINGYIISGRNTKPAPWQGVGIVSGSAAVQAKGLTGLAVAMNAKVDPAGVSSAILTTLDGQGVDQNCILVKYTWNGDMTLDGVVNFDDYFQINTGFLSNGKYGGYRWGDINFDGLINFDDYYLLNTSFLGQGNQIFAAHAPMSRAAAPRVAPGISAPKVHQHRPRRHHRR